MSDTVNNQLSDNVASLEGRTSRNRRQSVSLFAGWPFIRFKEGDAESFPFMPRCDYNAPVFEYNPDCFDLSQLENPAFAPFWLPMALSKLCVAVLADAMVEDHQRADVLREKGWEEFRKTICMHAEMTMDELARSARVNGFDSAVDYMTQCLYYESGLHDALVARQAGRASLRTA
jgi:hypothetical protein